MSVTDPRPRQARKQQTRRDLLAAARRVLARRGLAATTTREIAAEAGVAAGTFFLHFPDMNTLVETLLDDHVAAALADAFDTLPTDGDLVGELVHVAAALYASYDREPDLARQYLAATLFAANPDGPTRPRMERFEAWVSTRVAVAVSAGRVDPIDPALAFAGYFSLYFGILVAGLRGQLTHDQRIDLLDAALTRFLRTRRQS